MSATTIDWNDLEEINIEEVKKEFMSAIHGKTVAEMIDIADSMSVDCETLKNSSVAKFYVCGELIITVGADHKNLSKNDVLALFGLEVLKKIENENCEPTNRVGYNGACQGDALTEWSATVQIDNDARITAYYYTNNDEDAMAAECDDLSCINWVVDHYTVQ